MKRIIGIPISKKASAKPLKPSLNEMVTKIDTRAEELDKKISQCESELKKISARMKTIPEGAGKQALKAKAYGILQRKKKFEEQSETFKQQSFNIAQTSGTIDSAKDANSIVTAMKAGVKELKKEQKKVNVDMVEELQDELQELFENSEEIQDVFATDLNMPIMDDKELEDQIDALGDDLADDHDTSYLDAVSLTDSNKQSNEIQLPENTQDHNFLFPPPPSDNSKPTGPTSLHDPSVAGSLLNFEDLTLSNQPLGPNSSKNKKNLF